MNLNRKGLRKIIDEDINNNINVKNKKVLLFYFDIRKSYVFS
jgi:hypothetical protein